MVARLVKHKSQGPAKIEVGDETKYVCMCGLSDNKPMCDGSHAETQDEEEDELYVYDDQGKRVKVESMYE